MGNNKIVVNGIQRDFEKKEISYEEVVRFAYGNYDPNVLYTVIYYAGKSEQIKGSLVKQETVTVHSGMVFNATVTTQS